MFGSAGQAGSPISDLAFWYFCCPSPRNSHLIFFIFRMKRFLFQCQKSTSHKLNRKLVLRLPKIPYSFVGSAECVWNVLISLEIIALLFLIPELHCCDPLLHDWCGNLICIMARYSAYLISFTMTIQLTVDPSLLVWWSTFSLIIQTGFSIV